MYAFFSALFGYLLGSISPSALLAKVKNKDLRNQGTNNLGATNVSLTIGKFWGVLVMVFDMAKGYGAYKLAKLMFSSLSISGLISGTFAVIGHCFPFYLKFKGGKGLATFGGLVLGYNWLLFLILLLSTAALMFIVNHSFVVPFISAIVFFIHVAVTSANFWFALVAFVVSALVIWKHFGNCVRAFKGEDIKIRSYFRRFFSKKKMRDNQT